MRLSVVLAVIDAEISTSIGRGNETAPLRRIRLAVENLPDWYRRPISAGDWYDTTRELWCVVDAGDVDKHWPPGWYFGPVPPEPEETTTDGN